MIYNALITPFDENGNVDYEMFAKIVNDLKHSHDGFIVAGSTGEGLSLEFSEKKKLAKIVRGITNKFLMLNISEPNTFKCIKEIKKCNSIDVDAFLVTVPMYYRPTQEGIFKHFQMVEKYSDKDIYIYNVPQRTGADASIDTIVKLSKLTKIKGIKECGGIKKMQEIKSKTNLRIFSGNDLDYEKIDEFDGLISVISCLYIEELRNKKENFIRTINHIQRFNNPQAIKELMKKKYKEMYYRLPLVEMDKTQLNDLLNSLENNY